MDPEVPGRWPAPLWAAARSGAGRVTALATSRWQAATARSRLLRVAGAVAVVVALVGGWTWIVLQWLRMSWAGRVGWVAVVLVTFGAGVLSARYPRIGEVVERAFAEYFRGVAAFAASLLPLWVALASADLVVERLPSGLQLAVMGLWGLVLAVAVWLVSSPTRRDRVFERLRGFGPLAPWLYAVDVLAVALLFFAALTLLLHGQGRLAVAPAGGEVVTLDVLLGFYLWHFLDAVPLLDVPATLRWDVPADYDGAAVGWLLLGFKVAVILPVIAAFRGYWQHTHRRRRPPARRRRRPVTAARRRPRAADRRS